MTSAPLTETLSSERLALRRVRMDDAPRITTCVNDPRVYRMLARVEPLQSEASTRTWLETLVPGRAADTDHVFALESEGELIGVTGAHRRDTASPFEIGYWLAPTHWGRGLMTEAAGTLKRWLESEGHRALTSGYVHDNPASGRVLRKIGFMTAGRSRMFSLGRGETVERIDMAWIAGKA
ncbi:MAG: GNAT family N-acetyltransferase [Hyphomonas sp.]|nr:GNAT family N-acetyltransferase [Hyphomonas sp.]